MVHPTLLQMGSTASAEEVLRAILAEPRRLSGVPSSALWRTLRLVGSVLVLRALDQAALWIGRAAQRGALSELSETALRDIGVSPEAARREARKPFWEQ